MRFLSVSGACLLLLSASSTALSIASLPAVAAEVPQGPVVAREAIPDWLAPRSLPQPSADSITHAQDGQAYILTDWQVRGTDQGYDSYYRVATKVIDRSGLEDAGQLSTSYDPAFETVALHFVHIIRDGKVIDRTADVSFRVVEREDDLDDGIISGSLRAIATLKDVRVGDIVDYGMTQHVRTALWPGHYFASFSDRFSEPLTVRAIRFVWPASQPLRFRATNSDIAFTQQKQGDMVAWEWIGRERPYGPGEDDVPAWYPQYGRVELSTMADWASVARWATPLYAGDESLTPDFEQRLADIAKTWPKAEDRLTEISRYIQDNIRYVGEELGEGSYVPRRPKLVLERGYGDCKDKSLLLAVALKRLGIDAAPALVSTRPGRDLPDRLASPLMFDHVIVRAVIDGQVLWIDPTATHRGGRGLGITPSHLGYALPIRADQQALEKMEGYAARAGKMDVVERFEVDEAAPTAMTLHVETRYSGGMADWMRGRIATQSAAKMARGNLEFYQKRFPGLMESKPLAVGDDRDANIFTLGEDYTLSKAEFDKNKTLSDLNTNAYAVSDLLPDKQAGPRKQPLSLPANVSRDQIIEVKAKDRRLWAPDDIEMTAGGVHFWRKSKRDGDGVRIRYHLDSDDSYSVPASEAPAVYAISDKIGDESGLRFFIDKSSRLSETTGTIDQAELAPYRAELDKIVELTADKTSQASHIEALSLINKLAEKPARPSAVAGLFDGLKGLILAGLNRAAPARTALQSSIAQYQGNADMIRTLIALQLTNDDPPTVIKTMQVAQEKQPAIIRDFDLNWMQYLSQRIRALPAEQRETARYDLCMTLADGGWRMEPRTVEGVDILGCAIRGRLQRGQVDAARKLIALQPTPDTLASLAMDKRYQAIWPDLAKAQADGFAGSIDQAIVTAKAAADKTPDDFGAMTSLIRALRTAGRAPEAVAAGKALAARKDKIEATGDTAFWFVNEYAYALVDAGKTDEAIAQMDTIIALGLDEYPALVSQVINRAEMFNHADMPDRALAALTEADEKYAAKASLFGKMWIWAGKACALRSLNRGDEAKILDDKLGESPDENKSAVTMAAACRGDQATIEKLLLARLDKTEDREGALGLFVRFRKQPKPSAFDARLQQVMESVAAMPTVQARMKQYGRPVDFAGSKAYWGSF
jgi:transglutaminase-like putative cysteine protease/tetratricopeptide (TPR) repeat protein